MPPHPPATLSPQRMGRLTIGYVVAFVALLAAVLAHGVDAFNRAGLLWVHGFERPWLDPVALTLTTLGSVRSIALLGGLLGVAFLMRRRCADAAALAATLGGAAVWIYAIKHLVREARPTVFSPLTHETSYSFPSGHTFLSFSFFGFVALWLVAGHPQDGRRWAMAWLCAVIEVFIGFSRLYLGVHWPVDVLASAFGGTAWMLAVMAIRLRLMPRGT